MKILLPLLFTLALTSFSTLSFAEKKVAFTDSERLAWILSLDLEERNQVLRNAHQNFFSLPYSDQHISGVIMPQIRKDRLAVAPDFPERTANRSNLESVIFEWLENHPEQLANYLDFLEERYDYYFEKGRN